MLLKNLTVEKYSNSLAQPTAPTEPSRSPIQLGVNHSESLFNRNTHSDDPVGREKCKHQPFPRPAVVRSRIAAGCA